jgi:hypothetical protein
MQKRYIELYSANRNRELYPNMADFVVQIGPGSQFISQARSNNPYENSNLEYNNIQNASDPITTGPIYFTWKGDDNSITGTTKTGTTDAIQLLGTPGTGALSDVVNYYLGCNLTIDGQTRTILSYNPSSASTTPTLAFNNLASTTYIISDPSTNSLIYIPSIDGIGNSILPYAQAYNGYYIIDETLTYSTGSLVYSQITTYNFLSQIATLKTPFPTGWAVTDYYTLRKTLPSSLAVSAISNTINTIVLSANASSTDNIYNGNYVYLTPLSGDGSSPPSGFNTGDYINKSYYILSYDGATKTATIIQPKNIINIPVGGLVANIVLFVNENASPLNYNGSIVSQNETVAYEISLINLTLPNVVLETGSRIVYYPFVFCKLENVTSPSTASGSIIYCNNPVSSKALFNVPITDVNQPVNTIFLKVDSGAMVQTVKFKPNDSLSFSIFLPNGELFKPVQKDNFSPYPSNPLLQIDAVFSIKRV